MTDGVNSKPLVFTPQPMARDNTYVKPPVIMPLKVMKEPDLNEKSATSKVIGTDNKLTAHASASVGNPALKGDVDAIRASGNVKGSSWKPPYDVKGRYETGPTLNNIRTGGPEWKMEKGHMGAGVEDLQGKLNAAMKGTGMNSLATDGLYGPKTQAGVRAFQESRGLPVTGVVDKDTIAALDSKKPVIEGFQLKEGPGLANNQPTGVVSTVTANMSEGEKFEHYKAMIEKSGGKFNPNGPNIVGVRSATNVHTNGGGGRYDDTMAVIWTDKSGAQRVKEFRGNTEPSGNYEGRMGSDVNGDGSLDQGRLRTGSYTYALRQYHGSPALGMVGDARVDRDVNHDGNFGNDGGASSMGGGSMLFHKGGNNSTGSAGCQTMAPGEFSNFMGALKEAGISNNGGRVGYTLVDAG